MKTYLNMKLSLLIAIIIGLQSCTSSNDESEEIQIETAVDAPKLETLDISRITYKSAKSGGEFLRQYLASEIEPRGVVWDTFENPTVDLESKTVDGRGGNNYDSDIIDLLPNTEYYVRAYGTSTKSGLTGYGNQIIFKTVDPSIVAGQGLMDIDGNTYPSLIINENEYSAKNLSVTKYKNGDDIPQVQDPTEWSNLTTGAWCYYENDLNNETYGKLYNWFAVNDPRGLAPDGWHVPSDNEWQSLQEYLISSGYNDDGSVEVDKLKSAVASDPFNLDPDYPTPTNRTGYSALAAGLREGTGEFKWKGTFTSWWSTTPKVSNGSEYIIFRDIYQNGRDGFRGTGAALKNNGFSVRLIKD